MTNFTDSLHLCGTFWSSWIDLWHWKWAFEYFIGLVNDLFIRKISKFSELIQRFDVWTIQSKTITKPLYKSAIAWEHM